jgi:hypothetical protein
MSTGICTTTRPFRRSPAAWHSTVLSVLQHRASASEPGLSNAGRHSLCNVGTLTYVGHFVVLTKRPSIMEKVMKEKKMLSAEEIEAQTLLELPDRQLMQATNLS